MLAMIWAAFYLSLQGKKCSLYSDITATYKNLGLLRASARGFRHTAQLLRSNELNQKLCAAKHNAKLFEKHARMADRLAAKVCHKLQIPFECQHQVFADDIWFAFCKVYVAVNDWDVSWLVIVTASLDDCLSKYSTFPETFTSGATREELDAYNARVIAEWRRCEPDRAALLADHRNYIGKLTLHTTVGGTCPHYERDKELMYWARVTWNTMVHLINAYSSTRARALAH